MASLPEYVAAAQPVPQDARSAWYKNTAQTYAGIMLWFVFWQKIVSESGTPGGSLAAGLGVALLGLLIAALFCHFLTYLVPGLLGMKTGLPLYVVGTSTYGVRGGFLMPGFFMGVLQFGWLAVNGFFSTILICQFFELAPESNVMDDFQPNLPHAMIAIAFIVLAVLIGLKGIQYVARVATWVPLIPLAILIILLIKTAPGLTGGKFDEQQLIETNKAAAAAAAEKAENPPEKAEEGDEGEKGTEGPAGEGDAGNGKAPAADEEKAEKPASSGEKVYLRGLFTLPTCGALFVLLFLSKYVVGFFATAGAAGVDFGMNNRDGRDVQLGGLVGIVGATVFAGGVAMLVVAGAYGIEGMVSAGNQAVLNPVELLKDIVGETSAKWMMLALALASFAPACFPAFIAANSFRTTMPKFGMPAVVIGTLASIGLAVSGWAGQAMSVFVVVGASFGPICGAMMADYLLAGRKWAGPRAAFNPAGWISWVVGFAVGGVDLLVEKLRAVETIAAKAPWLEKFELGIPCPPMAALIVGFVLYIILAKAGLESRKLEMPKTAE